MTIPLRLFAQILTLLTVYSSSVALAIDSCEGLFATDNRIAATSNEMRFLKIPATKEYLDGVKTQIPENDYFWRFDIEAYNSYISSQTRFFAQELKISIEEVLSNPALANLILHPLEFKMIRQYTGDFYTKLNSALRLGDWLQYRLETEILNSALSRMRLEDDWSYRNLPHLKDKPRESLVRRYIDIDIHNPEAVASFLSRYKVGATVEEASFLSTTNEFDKSRVFVTGNILFEITQTSGVYVSTISATAYKNGKMEAEIILPPKTKFVVTEILDGGNYAEYIIKMTEVDR